MLGRELIKFVLWCYWTVVGLTVLLILSNRGASDKFQGFVWKK